MVQSHSKTKSIQDVKGIVDRFSPIPQGIWDEFSRNLSIETAPKGTVLQKSGEPVTRGWVVLEGIVRNFSASADGDEVTIAFFSEGSVACVYAAFLRQEHSRDTLQTIEDTTCVAFDLVKINTLVERHPEWNTFLRKVTEYYLVSLYGRSISLLHLNASERLALFKEKRSDLIPRLSQRHLASYLGITREALNRLMRESE